MAASGRRSIVVLVVIVLATLCVACSNDDGDGSAARVTSPDERLTDAEWDFGASFDRQTDGVTYQPDVVIPGGGAESVVQVSGDGLTWTLDGDAAEVGDLAPGKLLLVTNRGAGRVLAVEQVADGDVAVTLGPAEITDFFRDLQISHDGEIDRNLIQIRVAPTLPSAADVTNRAGDETAEPGEGEDAIGDDDAVESPADEGADPAPGDGGDGGPTTGGPDPDAETPTTTTTTEEPAAAEARPAGAAGPARYAPPTGGEPGDRLGTGLLTSPTAPPLASTAAAWAGAVPAQGGQAAGQGILPPVAQAPMPVVPVEGMRAFPLHGSDGSWGVELAYDRNGLKVVGSARVYLERPSIRFDLDIRDGKVATAEAVLDGVAGVRASFDASTETGLQANIHQVVDLPIDISMPILGPGLPFAVNFHQSFKIDTVFSAKNSTLSFNGDYAFRGSLRAGYRDGSFEVGAPSGLSVKRSLLQSTNGVSLGVNGFIIAHKLRMTIGIGGFGFAVGPYVSLTTAMSVVNGSDLGMVKCKGANLILDMGYGIGYVMPLAVVKVINVFLRALNIGEIKPTGGTGPITTHLATLQGYAPKLKICEGAV